MNVLIIAATPFEVESVNEYLGANNFRFQNGNFSLHITGIGAMATTYHLLKSITEKRPDFVIQAGIAGSFHAGNPPGSVVYVSEELMGDLGAEESSEFRDVFDLRLMNENDAPFKVRTLRNPYADHHRSGSPTARSITVNEITTRKERIDLIRQKYSPDIESMEGAALHYTCLLENIPFVQVRAISNFVGERNKENWEIKSAIQNLNKRIIEMISSLTFLLILI